VIARTTFLVAFVAMTLSGCGNPPPEIATLEGKVTVGGKVVTSGLVGIRSEDGVTQTSAEIRPDGTYSVIGAPVGPALLRVETSSYRTLEPEPGNKQTSPRPNPRYVETPKRYEKFETSGLSTTIGTAGSTFDIVLVP
jgi:hypothetical protein